MDMILTELTKEDQIEIRKLAQEIAGKAPTITYSSFLGANKHLFDEQHVGASPESWSKRRMKDRYSFTSSIEVGFALYTFFNNLYNVKHIAKNLYIRPEDQTFTEQFDALIPLGKVENRHGEVLTSSVVEAVLKVRNQETRNEYTGFPFDILSFRIICP